MKAVKMLLSEDVHASASPSLLCGSGLTCRSFPTATATYLPSGLNFAAVTGALKDT
jgi:hypothetical protein